MALHTYTPYEWKNAPDHKTTPLSADNLNHIEQGIKNAEDDIAEVDAKTGTHMESLWQNSFPSILTDYTLSKSIEDYAYVIILLRTNAEEQTIVVPTSVIKANYGTSMWYQSFCCSGGTGQVAFPLAYNAVCFVAFTNATTMRFNVIYNNGNYVLKPIEIFGVK